MYNTSHVWFIHKVVSGIPYFRPFFQIFPNSKVSNVIGNVAMKLRKPNGIVVTFLTIDFFSKKLKKRYFCNSGPVLGVLGHFFKIFPTEFF